MTITEICKQIYFKSTGYSYTNLGRLFLRLFVGIMMMQFGVRQIIAYDEVAQIFPAVLGMTSATSLVVMIVLEIGCSLFIMAGFLTRMMTLPISVAMIMAEYHLLHYAHMAQLSSWTGPGYIPILFLGIYCFILLVGPGKISVDYFYSLHLLHSEDKNEEDLEEV